MKRFVCLVLSLTILAQLSLAAPAIRKRPEISSLEDLRINVESYMRSMGLMVKARIILTDEGLELEVIPDDDDEAKRRQRGFKQWRKSNGVVG